MRDQQLHLLCCRSLACFSKLLWQPRTLTTFVATCTVHILRPDQGNFLFLIPARIDFCWPQEIKTQYKTHRIGFLERSLAKTQAWGPWIMSRLAWTTKITALCEVSSCVNSSVFVFLAPARIIFSIFWDEKQEISLVWPNCRMWVGQLEEKLKAVSIHEELGHLQLMKIVVL